MWVRLCLLCDSALLSVLLSLTNKWEENQQWEGNERRPPMGGKSRLKPRAASTCLLYYEYYEVNHDFWPCFGGKNFPSCLSFSASQLFLLLNSSFHSLWCGRKACAGSLKNKTKKTPLKYFRWLASLTPHPTRSSPLSFPIVTLPLSHWVVLWNSWTASCLPWLS